MISDRSKCGAQMYLRWKLWRVRSSCRNWIASVFLDGSRAFCVRGTMKQPLTSVCSARRHALRSILSTKLDTQWNLYAVSCQTFNWWIYWLLIDGTYPTWFFLFLFFVFPCRVWYLSVFGIPLWHVVVWLCRFTQQVNFSLIWRCIITIIHCPNYFFFFYIGAKFSSILLVWAPAWLPLS